MGIGTKTCQKCQKIVASAKKVCDCGHIFLEKKRRGFQETPIVITSDRLRSSRLQECDTRPVRVKKHKYHGTDFVYSESKSENMQNSSENIMVTEEESVTLEIDGKQYSKRERTKTPKYEVYVFKNKNKKMNQPEYSPSKAGENADTNQMNNRDLNVENTSCSSSNDSNKTKEIDSINDEDKANDFDNRDDEFSFNAEDDFDENYKDDESINKSRILDDNDNASKSDEHKDKSKMLVRNFDSLIDICTDCEFDNCPLLSTLPPTEESSLSESESITEDDVKLKQVRMPRHLRDKIAMSKKKSPEIDDIPLSKLMRNDGITGPMRIGKDGKLKRPVGRPRKHPFVIKVKRPVGRPRKDRSLETKNVCNNVTNGHTNVTDNKEKPRRGRPPSDFSFGMYAEHFFYDDEDEGDDEADPDYKSPTKTNASPMNRSNRAGRACFLSPSQIMDRMRVEFGDMEVERWKKNFNNRHAIEIPPEKKELYSHILKEINRRILSQSFTCAL